MKNIRKDKIKIEIKKAISGTHTGTRHLNVTLSAAFAADHIAEDLRIAEVEIDPAEGFSAKPGELPFGVAAR